MALVSIIVPCYNEERTIRLLLEAIYAQTYPRDQLEVILADGMSSDRTREEIADFQQEKPDLKIIVVNNEQRTIPSGLNRAIEASSGEFFVRLDAHSVPSTHYVEYCVQALQDGLGDNVGGVWEIRPGGPGWIARSIAVAAAHPFGVGDALYRYANQAQYVDTVPFGAFRRDLLERVGKFDETLLTNEDYEFNTRIRKKGGRVWLDPKIRSGYFSRATLSALSRQYVRYGYWKLRMLRRYPDTLRWRQALPPVFTAGLMGLLFFSIFWPFARYLFLLLLVIYLFALVMGTMSTIIQRRDAALLVGVPLAISTMHLSWGSGFIVSLFRK